jgi:uncharacterized membrane protein YhhN
MGLALVSAALATAVGDWMAVAVRSKRAEYALKPLVMALLLAAAIELRHGDPALRCAFTAAALVFSLAGDLFLMLPRDLFVAGLASFLFAHVSYVVALNTPWTSAPSPGLAVASILGVGAVSVPMWLRIRAGLSRLGRRALVPPVTAYVLVISVMVVFAVLTVGRPGWSAGRSALAVAGAALFFASDGMIGWSRFVSDFPGSRVLIMVSYHLGQVGLVLGLLGAR